MDLLELLALDEIEDYQAWHGSVKDAFGLYDEGTKARIAELETALAEAEQKYTEVAARNYELMLAVTDAPAEETEEEVEEEVDIEAAVLDNLKEEE